MRVLEGGLDALNRGDPDGLSLPHPVHFKDEVSIATNSANLGIGRAVPMAGQAQANPAAGAPTELAVMLQ
jgi:hypothetical protein